MIIGGLRKRYCIQTGKQFVFIPTVAFLCNASFYYKYAFSFVFLNFAISIRFGKVDFRQWMN